MKHLLLAFVVILGFGACGSEPDACAGPDGEIACASQLADDGALPGWLASSSSARNVTVYFDRSGSMRGFLDPQYPADVPTDYLSVMDRLVVGLRPTSIYGFGSALRSTGASPRVLWERAFYSDSDTRMEEVFARVAADTLLESTHVIVGDGRRGSPTAANAQFVEMRSEAQRWIDAGGTFIVAASMAPFAPIADDPAGCRAVDDARSQGCPLYAFTFVAPGDEQRIGMAIADVFEHFFAWPLHTVVGQRMVLHPQGTQSGVAFDRNWARGRDSVPVSRSTGSAASNQPLNVRLQVADSTDPLGRLTQKALQGQRLRPRLASRPLMQPAQPWRVVDSGRSVIRVSDEDPMQVQLMTHGPDADPFLYRLEVTPLGEPTWLAHFNAENVQDDRRTLGLHRLFELFRQRGAGSEVQPSARVYIVAN